MDLSKELVSGLNNAQPPFLEPGLGELLATNVSNGRLGFTLDPTALEIAEFIVICVDTPRFGDSADLRRLERALDTIAYALNAPLVLPTVVLKSTTPIGTADAFDARLRSLSGADTDLVVNPEFLRQGSAVADFLRPDRIVLGSETRAAGEKVADLYFGLDAPLIRTDRRTAEFIKHASSAFLATRVYVRLSFAGEVCGVAQPHRR